MKPGRYNSFPKGQQKRGAQKMRARSPESPEKTTPVEANHDAAWKAGCRRERGDVFPKEKSELDHFLRKRSRGR
jgi:hypothetical protein